ncbi:alpha/beta-hydrolase N-terminal domain-containing protein [Humibacillus xanthopallidus]|uniref:Alpha/beta hydrolase family protein n=1 Tax=Humibacillus xanthopallidus TaxID=412689 RepID=A0A543HTC4_9MICO|nr:alpha/beta-hydrolase N-terminal domain-containing protein [Humibacillus xanthopallidus]TQM61595.1 alpha/beta hydrolase family protein [Humibacillus xanthopallidus]
MSPSLLPRTWYYQGMITGLCAAAGYALGSCSRGWCGRSLASSTCASLVSGEARHWILVAAPVFAAVAVVAVTVSNVRSQAPHRRRRGARPLSPLDWVLALLLAAAITAALIALARGCAA